MIEPEVEEIMDDEEEEERKNQAERYINTVNFIAKKIISATEILMPRSIFEVTFRRYFIDFDRRLLTNIYSNFLPDNIDKDFLFMLNDKPRSKINRFMTDVVAKIICIVENHTTQITRIRVSTVDLDKLKIRFRVDF